MMGRGLKWKGREGNAYCSVYKQKEESTRERENPSLLNLNLKPTMAFPAVVGWSDSHFLSTCAHKVDVVLLALWYTT